MQFAIDGPDVTTRAFETSAQKGLAYLSRAIVITDTNRWYQSDTVWRSPLSEHTYQTVIADSEGSGL